ncbi:MAG: hypothetical protein LZ166_04805 [Thaumarchaeota archaeon]|jgi:hypothetical protein|nr:hypothetical protein [Candidatus Wolframiiraptor allenii]
MKKIVHVAVIILCLFLSILVSTSSQEMNFDREYVSLPPAETSYLSIATSDSFHPALASKAVVHSLESGSYIASLYALYPSGWEEVCQSPPVYGPGKIDLSMSCGVRDGYQGIRYSLFTRRAGENVWIQSIGVDGVGVYCLRAAAPPNIKEVTLEDHRDLGGMLVHVVLNSPGDDNHVSVRIYRDGQIVYEFAKTVSIPGEWAYSPCIDLYIDFGPLYLKRGGSYAIQVEMISHGRMVSRSITFERPEAVGWITVSVNNPYGALWRVYWSDDTLGTRSGAGSDIWSIRATSGVDFRAEILGNPTGYICSIYPSIATALPGDQLSFKIDCTPIPEKTVTYTATTTRTETQTVERIVTATTYVTKTITETVTATIEKTTIASTAPMILSIAAIVIAIIVPIIFLMILRKKTGH